MSGKIAVPPPTFRTNAPLPSALVAAGYKMGGSFYLNGARTTLVWITSPSGVQVEGIARKHPDDPFDIDKGAAIAYGRAWKQLQKMEEPPANVSVSWDPFLTSL